MQTISLKMNQVRNFRIYKKLKYNPLKNFQNNY